MASPPHEKLTRREREIMDAISFWKAAPPSRTFANCFQTCPAIRRFGRCSRSSRLKGTCGIAGRGALRLLAYEIAGGRTAQCSE
jgi:hypothetical protein